MPFGKYKDFKNCVKQNQDKDNPEGYCAAVHKKVTGKYPREEEYKPTRKERLDNMYERIIKNTN